MQLRWYQEEVIQSIYNYFMTKSGNPLIALPTGTGKSHLPAEFIKRVLHQWPNQKFLMITHVKELIKQNAEKLLETWPNAPLGIYSAGLKRKDIGYPIIYGSIQSMSKNPAQFGHRDIIWVDEAHLISLDDSSMYLTFISTMKLLNPYVKVVGMTATPFRMGQGMLTDPPGLFTDIIYDMTSLTNFNKLIEEGFLAPLIPKRTKVELDVTNVGVQKGEYVASQLQEAVDKNEITYNALKEAIHYGHDRRSWLIFSSGIEHSDHIAEMLTSFGIDCASVHSKQTDQYNDNAIAAFKSGELRALSSFSKLTTGFDNPMIDLIVDLRPTLSIPLHVQKYGRGTRPFENKLNCLCLDFARNIPRLGAVNDPIIPRKKGEKTGDAPVKICDLCGVYNHAAARFCCNCGEEFIFKIKIVREAGTEELIKSDKPIFETFEVDHAIYAPRQKLDKITKAVQGAPYIQVTYICNKGMHSFKEFVFPEHSQFLQKKFRDWWSQRMIIEPPKTTSEALQYITQFRTPSKITVHVNKRYPEVLSVQF